jgi:LruC domain-containing protein
MKHSSLQIIILALALSALVAGCIKQQDVATAPAAQTTIETMNPPPAFTFAMSSTVNAQVSGASIGGAGLEGIPYRILDASVEAGGRELYAGATASGGDVTGTFVMPTYLDTVVVVSDYIGVPHEVTVPVYNGVMSFTYGNVPVSPAATGRGPVSLGKVNSVYRTLGSWSNVGIPSYLEPKGDVIDAALLARINASLPEYKSVPVYRPQYITPEDKSTILYTDADVYVTFIHEGAGYTNALAYYTYPVNSPPASVAKIDTLTIIFPNASYAGSGGGLKSGDKVKLGRFPANTAIGWCVISNAFSGGTVGAGLWKLYSNTSLNNPPATAALRQHAMVLNDVGYDRLILSFEDIRRDVGGCDNDFNDVVFAITANPPTALSVAAIPTVMAPSDADGDGVADEFDAYPHDPLRAFDSFMPAKGVFGSLAFEDLWPGIGDYDFNDMVVDYNVQQVSNAKNQVVEMKAKYVLRAVGASYHSGFGFELPVAVSQVASVTGTKLTSGLVKTLGNGCETGQTKAVVVVFDDALGVVHRPGGYYVNTQIGAPTVAPDTMKVTVTFSTPVAAALLGTASYNPFIIVNQDRGKEVHLMDQPPTALASPAYYGMFADKTNPATGKTYRSKLNHPWALNFPERFDYPVEYQKISDAYVNFISWAESGGAFAKDWYKNSTGNRKSALIYHP